METKQLNKRKGFPRLVEIKLVFVNNVMNIIWQDYHYWNQLLDLTGWCKYNLHT